MSLKIRPKRQAPVPPPKPASKPTSVTKGDVKPRGGSTLSTLPDMFVVDHKTGTANSRNYILNAHYQVADPTRPGHPLVLPDNPNGIVHMPDPGPLAPEVVSPGGMVTPAESERLLASIRRNEFIVQAITDHAHRRPLNHEQQAFIGQYTPEQLKQMAISSMKQLGDLAHFTASLEKGTIHLPQDSKPPTKKAWGTVARAVPTAPTVADPTSAANLLTPFNSANFNENKFVYDGSSAHYEAHVGIYLRDKYVSGGYNSNSFADVSLGSTGFQRDSAPNARDLNNPIVQAIAMRNEATIYEDNGQLSAISSSQNYNPKTGPSLAESKALAKNIATQGVGTVTAELNAQKAQAYSEENRLHEATARVDSAPDGSSARAGAVKQLDDVEDQILIENGINPNKP